MRLGRTLFCSLFFLGGFFSSFGASAQKIDPNNPYDSTKLYIESCRSLPDLAFGGNSQSFFETKSCSSLIQQFNAIEFGEGAAAERLEKFKEKNKIKYSKISDCPLEITLKGKRKSKSCIENVFKLLDQIKFERDFFINALQFKIRAYDAAYVQNRNLLLNVGSQEPKASCAKVSPLADFKRSSKKTETDCEWVRFAAPDCELKLGTPVDSNLYGPNNQNIWADRKACSDYISQHTAKFEPFARLTMAERDAMAEKIQQDGKESAAVDVDCTNFNPDRGFFLGDSKTKTAAQVVDTALICAERAGQAASGGGSRSSPSGGGATPTVSTGR